MASAQTLFTKMYEGMQQNQGTDDPNAGGNAGGSTGSADDVVDADFKEL